MTSMIDWLRDDSLSGIDVDAEARMAAHAQVLARKPILRAVFAEFHHLFRALDERYLTGLGKRIELGAGIAPMRDSYPDVLATDVVADPHLDMILDAQQINLPDESVRVFYAQNCFHHLGQPSQFFRELERTLVPGGGAILLEPYYGPVAGFLFRRLFRTEGFDKAYPSWQTPVEGPMNGANQALSYIVFIRDRASFERDFPDLEIVHHRLCNNYLRYLASGGLNFRQLVPNWSNRPLQGVEFVLSPLNRLLSIHHVVVLRKRS